MTPPNVTRPTGPSEGGVIASARRGSRGQRAPWTTPVLGAPPQQIRHKPTTSPPEREKPPEYVAPRAFVHPVPPWLLDHERRTSMSAPSSVTETPDIGRGSTRRPFPESPPPAAPAAGRGCVAACAVWPHRRCPPAPRPGAALVCCSGAAPSTAAPQASGRAQGASTRAGHRGRPPAPGSRPAPPAGSWQYHGQVFPHRCVAGHGGGRR